MRIRLLVRERIEDLGSAGGLPSGSILSGLSRTQHLKKPSANHLPVILKSNTKTRFEIFRIFHHHLPLTQKFTESQAAS